MSAGLSREATLVKTVMEIKWIVLLQTRHATARVGRNEHSRRSPFQGGNDFGGGVPQQRVQSSLGSGVILRADGLIVTNNHVIKNSDQITVVLNDRREYPAHVLLADERVDLAVLKIDPGKTVLPTLAP